MKRKLLFIDRDGTIIKEPPVTFQVDTLEQLSFLPGVIRNLYKIGIELDYDFVLVTNQDGLGTASYPEENFNIVQNKMLEILSSEGVHFKATHIDRSFEHEKMLTRKPGIGMLGEYFKEIYDLANSFVIGDRLTDVELAKNMGAQAIFIRDNNALPEITIQPALIANGWDDIYTYLKSSFRKGTVGRKTTETDIRISLNIDGTGQYKIDTGLGFFNHMLEQLSKHSNTDLEITVKGDLEIDEHHTIEDTAIALGEAFQKAIGNKRGLERYGYCLPMDDCLAQVAIDMGGRSWLEWDASFKREHVGDMPTEMFYHFFKSFSDAAKWNLNIKAEGMNEHHKIEAIFKAFARAIKMAVKISADNPALPTTKGIL